MDHTIIREIAEREYDLLVVNTHAAAIQHSNGYYLTKYFPVTPLTIEHMILSGGSMGCYQQTYKTGYIKWICFDFDCKEKQNPDVERLYKEAVLPLTSLMTELGINFLTEFSGRRGIHVWVVFDTIISKRLGFLILQSLIKRLQDRIGSLESEWWHLDKYPATDSSRGNVVGRQVKFPLSSHKTGGMSYFFINGKHQNDLIGEQSFFEQQLRILTKYETNGIEAVIESLNLDLETIHKLLRYRFKKYRILDTIEVSTEQVRGILSRTVVFRNLFHRMMSGRAIPEDWTMLLGTLAHCDPQAKLLKSLLQEFPNYDEEKTAINLEKLKDRYYPATFGYLYRVYDLPMEPELDPEETGFHYLLQALDLQDKAMLIPALRNEYDGLFNIEDTITKERRYLLYNDEAPDISIWNQLRLFNRLDQKLLKKRIDGMAEDDSTVLTPEGFRRFIRWESEEKCRELVSLSACDRVITTNLALQLCYRLRCRWDSFSYRPMFSSRDDIFFAWYHAWGRYLRQIKAFLEVPFFDDYQILFVDLKGFYNHVDFLTVYEAFRQSLDEQSDRLFRCLLSFNDSLMAQLHEGERIGVPQGPAYARMIAELYLDWVLKEVLPMEKRDGVFLYRYVDDITIVCEPGIDGEKLFDELCSALVVYGLPVNSEKSSFFGSIGSLNEAERRALLHSDDFNYDLRHNEYTGILSRNDRNRRLEAYLTAHPFSVSSLGYIFGGQTITEAERRCFQSFRHEIFASYLGRGSNFRKFYRFLFKNDEYLTTVLDEGALLSIPTDSVNFSNFVAQLYLSRQNEEIDMELFTRLCEEYLPELNKDSIGKEDMCVIEAMRLIAEGDYS